MSTHHDKLGSYTLTESSRFKGNNLDDFKVAFTFMLDLVEKVYVIDDTIPRPLLATDAVFARGNRHVFNAL